MDAVFVVRQVRPPVEDMHEGAVLFEMSKWLETTERGTIIVCAGVGGPGGLIKRWEDVKRPTLI